MYEQVDLIALRLVAYPGFSVDPRIWFSCLPTAWYRHITSATDLRDFTSQSTPMLGASMKNPANGRVRSSTRFRVLYSQSTRSSEPVDDLLNTNIATGLADCKLHSRCTCNFFEVAHGQDNYASFE